MRKNPFDEDVVVTLKTVVLSTSRLSEPVRELERRIGVISSNEGIRFELKSQHLDPILGTNDFHLKMTFSGRWLK